MGVQIRELSGCRGRGCAVKENSELGFRKLRSFNIATHGGSKNNINVLVTSLMRALYFLNTDFLNANSGANLSYE